MNKEEFLNILRKRLNVLEDKEIEDIISEYQGYIEEKASIGKTEEEAIKELGDLDEIVSDLLSAYKVKTTNQEENSFNKFFNRIMKYLDKFIDELNKKSAKDILKFIVEICLILVIISLFKIPFSLLKELGWNIFSGMPLSLARLFYGIWSFLIELSYFILAIIMFIKIFEKRYFEGLSETIVTTAKDEINESKKERKTKKEKEIIAEEINEIKVEKVTKQKNSLFNSITNICLIFLKFIVMICLIGVIFYLIGMSVALGLMVYLIIEGVKYFGIAILLLALIGGGALLLELGINFIFNKKIKATKIFGEIISLIILTGIGLTLGAVEIANTEIIYENYYQDTKIINKIISMNNDLVLYNYDFIKIDNSLGNNIKIEYKYPNIEQNIDLNIELDKCGINCYHLNTNVLSIKWNKALFKDIIENLKDKKIYTYEFYIEKTIYLSQENYTKLIENNNKYNYYEDDNEFITFTRTYNILNVEESNSNEYLYLTLRHFQFEEVETVRILRSVANNIIEGKNYEFTFEYRGDDLDSLDIDEIFDECKLILVKETNKIG